MPPTEEPSDKQGKEANTLLAEAINAVLKEKGWSLTQAQIQTGVNRGTINNMRQGVGASAKYVAQFARAVAAPGEEAETVRRFLTLAGKAEAVLLHLSDVHFGQDPLASVGGEVSISHLRQIPLATGRVSANPAAGAEAIPDAARVLDDILPGEVRAIEVSGSCMEPFFQSGDVLLVRESKAAIPGDKVVALVDGSDVTCKVFRMNGKPWLEPTNGEGKIERFEIVGIVEALIRRERRH